jgi:hypothetical protein
MGFHATIAAGRDEFGNLRHKSAPRVRVTEKVTPYSQAIKGLELAGPVHTETVDPMWSDLMVQFQLALVQRKVTRVTETVSEFQRVSATQYVLKLSQFNCRIVVKKVNSKEFKGWAAFITPFGTNALIKIVNAHGHVRMGKGESVNTNGERADVCRLALNALQASLFKIS